MRPPKRPAPVIDEGLIAEITGRLERNKRVRRTLPTGGRIHIDRQLPFLCVYRTGADGGDPGIRRLITSEASYVIGPASGTHRRAFGALVQSVAKTLGAKFGAFLVIEIWPARIDPERKPDRPGQSRPAFRLTGSRTESLDTFMDAFEGAMAKIVVSKLRALVESSRKERISPPGMTPLVDHSDQVALNCTVLGLEVEPIYVNPVSGVSFPLVLREMERQVTRALRQTFYVFARTRTTQRPRHYHGLGRRAVVQAVWDADRRLAEISNSFDFLLQVTPYNASRAWSAFDRSRCEKAPILRYRPLPIDPLPLKRRLFATPIERLEDPTLRALFREKVDELDRKLTMLGDLNTPRFMHGSLALFGAVDTNLARTADDILAQLPPRSRDDTSGGFVPLSEFVERARAEVAFYANGRPEINASVRIRDDISGLMVSHGSLLVGRDSRIPKSRAEALIQHEVGTHIVTYYNGRAQPFKQLYSGLAGYDALQEGIAVFAEFLVGGLSRPRMRLLAARVAAVKSLVSGASFVDTFRLLSREYGFEKRTAFGVTLRIYRGGGLTKDAVYLRGLLELLAYLRNNGSLEPLLIGKIATQHVPVIEELRWRRVLSEPPLRPRYLDAPGVAERLQRARAGLTVFDLIERTPRK